jgi:hypothetical protein
VSQGPTPHPAAGTAHLLMGQVKADSGRVLPCSSSPPATLATLTIAGPRTGSPYQATRHRTYTLQRIAALTAPATRTDHHDAGAAAGGDAGCVWPACVSTRTHYLASDCPGCAAVPCLCSSSGTDSVVLRGQVGCQRESGPRSPQSLPCLPPCRHGVVQPLCGREEGAQPGRKGACSAWVSRGCPAAPSCNTQLRSASHCLHLHAERPAHKLSCRWRRWQTPGPPACAEPRRTSC